MANAAQVASFIEIMAPLAAEQMEKHGGRLFASVCIAQAAHETGWGSSQIMMRYNAPFGIKAGASAYHFGSAWKGASYNTKTKEYYGGSQTPTVIRDNFRAYSSLMDATEDYMDMLCTASRYRAALSCKSPEESIKAIVAAGYATGHSYADRIINIIETYGLRKYDTGQAKKGITPALVYSVVTGSYGNGAARQKALEAAGYDYKEVQAKIKELDRIGKEALVGIKAKAAGYAGSVLKLMSL